jgi:hypothetical protein
MKQDKMSNLNIIGELLLASEDSRVLKYKLLPFGEMSGLTKSGHRFTANKGAVKIPKAIDHLIVNAFHEHDNPIGRFIEVEEKDDAIYASLRISEFDRGDELLEAVRAGEIKGISIEVRNPVLRDGVLLGGEMIGAALTPTPSIASALLMASDMGELEPTDSPEQDAQGAQKVTQDSDSTPTKENNMENISNENLEAASAETAPVVSQPAPVLHAGYSNKLDLGVLAFGVLKNGGNAPQLNAALADQLTTSDAGNVYLRDQEIGEVWEARKADRPLANAITNKTLTGLTVAGNKKNRTFVVQDWAGNKAEIPSSTYSTELVTANSAALAGAVDIALELIEFGSADIISDLYESAVEDYAKKSEAKVTTALLAGATNNIVIGSLFQAIDHASQALGSIGARITHISVSSDVYTLLMGLSANSAPWWLQGQGSLNLGNSSATTAGVTFAVNPNLAPSTVLVLDSRAATLYESKEIRFRALDVAHGGVDIAFVKFFALLVTDPASVLKYTDITSL